ncbi:MAG TPA: GNAT family N-acetyltransferase [Rummeliibacillus sp.]|nr:GNAT family N-acetyltransferase [Rummeliibacillus sp.]
MIIRVVEEQDTEAFLKLLREVDDSNNMLFNPGERNTTVEKQRNIIKAFKNNPRSAFFIAEKNGELSGYIGIIAEDLQRTQHIGRIVIGVSEQSRGLGIGTKLFQEVFEWIQGKYFTRLELTVIVTNTAAINLYEKMGFIIEGKRIDSLNIDGQFVDEWSMYKRV